MSPDDIFPGCSLSSSTLPMALPPRFSVVRLIANWSPASCVIPREPASSTEISARALARIRCVHDPAPLSAMSVRGLRSGTWIM